MFRFALRNYNKIMYWRNFCNRRIDSGKLVFPGCPMNMSGSRLEMVRKSSKIHSMHLAKNRSANL